MKRKNIRNNQLHAASRSNNVSMIKLFLVVYGYISKVKESKILSCKEIRGGCQTVKLSSRSV